jgi:hypothetical protein
MPKVGPLKGMDFNYPTPQTESMYFASINLTVDQYRSFLHAVRTNSLRLPNDDLDTGNLTAPGEYPLTDDTYAKLLSQLADHRFDLTSTELRDNILHFYSNPTDTVAAIGSPTHRQNAHNALEQLAGFTPGGPVFENPSPAPRLR